MDSGGDGKFTSKTLVDALTQALAICAECGIEPVLIGGMALDAYTASRATMDLDFLADFQPDLMRTVAARIVATGGRLEDESVSDRPRDTRMLRF